MAMADRQIRSWVRREGRMTDGQRRALEDHWLAYGLDLGEGPIDPVECFGRRAPLVVEIGFGMGDSLFAMAKADPGTDFLGIEVHRPGVGHLLSLVAAEGLSNVRVFNADGVDVMEQAIPPSSVDRIQIFFPDPWHKKRHHKRRLITREFAQTLSRCLKPGGTVHVATDWPEYAESIREAFAGLHQMPAVSPPARVVTKYERRGVGLGHEITDLAYRKR
jgi:tRNA (guanine-N7-)-methyltransferase